MKFFTGCSGFLDRLKCSFKFSFKFGPEQGFLSKLVFSFQFLLARHINKKFLFLSPFLGKDKFSLLGSQLQQQESKIFSRNTQPTNGLTNGLSAKPSSMAPSSTISKFDPNKFRKVNEVSSGNMTSFGGFSGSGGGFSSSRNGGVKKAGLGVSGPLDDRDEELIASIEREFDFSC